VLIITQEVKRIDQLTLKGREIKRNYVTPKIEEMRRASMLKQKQQNTSHWRDEKSVLAKTKELKQQLENENRCLAWLCCAGSSVNRPSTKTQGQGREG
jgi:hypothetical protein